MHLGHRRGCHGLYLEGAEGFADGLAQRVLDDPHGLLAGKRGHPILQGAELVRNVQRYQIPPRGKQLSEFDEHRPELLQRQQQAPPARFIADR